MGLILFRNRIIVALAACCSQEALECHQWDIVTFWNESQLGSTGQKDVPYLPLSLAGSIHAECGDMDELIFDEFQGSGWSCVDDLGIAARPAECFR